MNTESVLDHPVFDPARFACDVSLTRPATRLAFQTFVEAYDREGGLESYEPLLDVVKSVCFVENPLDVLDLLRARDENRLIRETVLHIGEGPHPTTRTAIHFLELESWDWSILIVVAPEAVALLQPMLREVDGASTVIGFVERFAL